MSKFLFTLCAASCALFISAGPSLARNATEGISLQAPIEGVTLITISIPDEINDDELADDRPVVISNRVIVVIAPPNRRLERLRRVFGHRYPGFIKLYSGPRYTGFIKLYSGPRYPF
jgi:hypothetical protein